MTGSFRLPRRRILQGAGSIGLAGLLGPGLVGRATAQAGSPIHFVTWSAAIDQVQNHIAGFEAETGLSVAYENSPGAQFRQTLVTKFVTGAPIDVMWLNDSWLPEFAEAGWIAPIDQFGELTAYNAEVEDYCNESMMYGGRQYGLVYYSDFMAFLYNEAMLSEAGFDRPPESWDEVVEYALEIKGRGLSDYPMLLSLQTDASWMIEFISAMAFSFGGRFVDDEGNAVMNDPDGGVAAALRWMHDAVQVHEIVSPAAVSTQEIDGLRAFGAGQHAFGIIPRYRIKPLNDPEQSQISGHVRLALMPRGGETGEHATCGWVRHYALSSTAAADADKAAACARLIEWFGGRANGDYAFQRDLLLDLGVPFCTTPLNDDPEVVSFYQDLLGGVDTVNAQAALARKKDVVTPWFGEWNQTNMQEWQRAILGQTTIQEALDASAAEWERLRVA